jgi:hypothetical protein
VHQPPPKVHSDLGPSSHPLFPVPNRTVGREGLVSSAAFICTADTASLRSNHALTCGRFRNWGNAAPAGNETAAAPAWPRQDGNACVPRAGLPLRAPQALQGNARHAQS